MSGPQFFQTRMGREFYDRTMLELVRQLQRLNELLERLMTELHRESREQEDP